jgi:hypothetical protein
MVMEPEKLTLMVLDEDRPLSGEIAGLSGQDRTRYSPVFGSDVKARVFLADSFPQALTRLRKGRSVLVLTCEFLRRAGREAFTLHGRIDKTASIHVSNVDVREALGKSNGSGRARSFSVTVGDYRLWGSTASLNGHPAVVLTGAAAEEDPTEITAPQIHTLYLLLSRLHEAAA